MSVATIYLNNDTRQSTSVVRVGGVQLLNVLSADWNFAFQQVPTASIRVPNPAPGSAVFDAAVIIDCGFDGLTVRVFTGTVLNVNTDETGCTIECQGMSKVLDNAFHKIVLPFTGAAIDAETLVEGLLDDAGVVAYSVNLPHWHPGTRKLSVDPDKDWYPVLEFSTYGEAITKIAEVDGGRWFETPTGVVCVAVMDPVPSLTSWRTYFSMQLTGIVESYPAGIVVGRPRLRRISSSQQARDVKNRCYVTGCTYEETNPTDLTVQAIDIEGDAQAASPWVKNPDGTQAYNDELFSNELIDYADKAGWVAGRIVTVLNRLLTEVSVEIDGDPEPVLGVTVRIEDPGYSRVTGRWFLESYSSSISSSGFSTSLTLLGGIESGSSTNISPFAIFTYAVEQEVIGDRTWAIVTLDASGSIDPDGTIVSWCWDDNLGLLVPGLCGEVVTVRIDPDDVVGTWEVILTVTDDDPTTPATDDITLVVTIDVGSAAVTVPAIFCAFDNHFSGTPDGGITWNDQDAPGGDSVISVGAKGSGEGGIAVFGTTLGALYRTIDFCAMAPTPVMAACGFPIWDVKFSVNVAGEVWAVSRNGLLYLSQDDGLTWVLYEDLAAKFGLNDIICKSIATPVGSIAVWVFGGTGTGWPLIVHDDHHDHNWTASAIGGELQIDLGDLAHSDIYIAGASSSGLSELSIILNSAAHTPAVYFTKDIHGDGSLWKKCLTPPAESLGMWMVCDWDPTIVYFGFNNNKVYKGTIDPTAGTITADAGTVLLTAGDWGNYTLWLGAYIPGIGSCHILAGEETIDPLGGTIWKSWDGFGTVAKLRPATIVPPTPCVAGMNAKMIAIGSPRLSIGEAAALMTGQTIYQGNLAGHWEKKHDGPGVSTYYKLSCRNGHWLYGETRGKTGDIWHSVDGITFTETFTHDALSGAFDYDIAPDGTVWLLVGSNDWDTNHNNDRPLEVYKSIDGGVTWVLNYTDTGWSQGGFTNCNTVPLRIAVHQQDKNTIVLCSLPIAGVTNQPDSIFTIDGGVSWTRRINPPNKFPRFPAGFSTDDMHYAASGRLVYLESSHPHVHYSDDIGVTWTQAAETVAFNAFSGCQLGWWRPDWFNNNIILLSKNPAGDKRAQVYLSRNNCASWDMVDADNPTFTFIGYGADYDAVSNQIIVAENSGNDVGLIDAAFSAPAKSDITGDLAGTQHGNMGIIFL